MKIITESLDNKAKRLQYTLDNDDGIFARISNYTQKDINDFILNDSPQAEDIVITGIDTSSDKPFKVFMQDRIWGFNTPGKMIDFLLKNGYTY